MSARMANGIGSRAAEGIRSHKQTEGRNKATPGGALSSNFPLARRKVERLDFIVAGVQKAGTTAEI